MPTGPPEPRRPRVLMMHGVAPGIGKSSLAESLAWSLQAQEITVDLFPEEQLFTRDDFSVVAEGFSTRVSPTPEAFLDAYEKTIGRCLASQAWLICDWNCAGMASDLDWAVADPARLDTLVRDVGQLAGSEATVLFLEGDIGTAIHRAVRQRGPDWVARMLRIADDHGVGPGGDIERIVAYEQSCLAANQRDRQVLAAGGWQVLSVDARGPAEDVLVQAKQALGIQ